MSAVVAVPVILAVLGGLFYVATKHPRMYIAELYTKLAFLGFGVVLGVIGFAVGGWYWTDMLLPLIALEKRTEALHASQDGHATAMFIALGVAVLSGYNLILYWLALHIAKEQRKE